jgi:hypothetical protein
MPLAWSFSCQLRCKHHDWSTIIQHRLFLEPDTRGGREATCGWLVSGHDFVFDDLSPYWPRSPSLQALLRSPSPPMSVALCVSMDGVVLFLFRLGGVRTRWGGNSTYHLCCVALRGGLVVDLCGAWPWSRHVASVVLVFSPLKCEGIVCT